MADGYAMELSRLMTAAVEGDLEQVQAILREDASLARRKDGRGATSAHYAALNGHSRIVRLLIESGADINMTDAEYGATPAGWAIEYLRELGGFLAIELKDLAYAVRERDRRWVARFLERFPALRQAGDTDGVPFARLARESGDPEIAKLFAET